MKKALIVWGGWDGHEPKQVAEIFKDILEKENFEVEVSNTLDSFSNREKLMNLNLIVPVWTCGQITEEQLRPVLEAVENGVGIAGCHGGMCDAFREATDWHFMTGGQWVAHPGNDGVEYTVNIVSKANTIVKDIPDFNVTSEQYYMHIDPAIEVLATTTFENTKGPHGKNKKTLMPVVWTKTWGEGKVFYNSLGHNAEIFNNEHAHEIMKRGLLWAAK